MAFGSISVDELISSNNISVTGNVSFTGNVTVGAGTASNAAISTSGDPNTGIFFPAADQVAITTGGTARLNVNATGQVTTPSQVAFSITPADNSYITTSPIPFDNADLNVGNHFNTSTYVFTAPVAGTYYFCLSVYLRADDTEDSGARIRINGTNSKYLYLLNSGAGGTIHIVGVATLIKTLAANDTVDAIFFGSGDYYGGVPETNFYGYLLG